jgi:hypothetical protein
MSPSLVSGLAGGLLATVVASAVFALAGRDRPLPAARLWARYVAGDGRPAAAVWPGLALHTLAGSVAGGVFALLAGFATDPGGHLPLQAGVGLGVGYGLVLFAIHVGGVLWAILDVGIDRELLAESLVLHVIYGTVLGAWIGVDVLAVV